MAAARNCTWSSSKALIRRREGPMGEARQCGFVQGELQLFAVWRPISLGEQGQGLGGGAKRRRSSGYEHYANEAG